MYRDRSIRVVDRIKVSPDPVRLVVSADGSFVRRGLALVAPADVRRAGTAECRPIHVRRFRSPGTLDLPFCPRELAVVADGSRLIVADAFGGRLAVVDYEAPIDRLGPVAARAQHPRPGLRAGRPDAGGRASGAQPPRTDQL